MAFNLFDAVLRSSSALRSLRNRIRFPGLGMASSVVHRIEGRVHYGTGCSIGQSSILIVPRAATLRLGDGVYVGRNVELGPSGTIDIGDSTSIQDRSLLVGEVRIGRYCTLSLNVLMTSGRHYYDLVPHWFIRDQDTYALTDPGLAQEHQRPVHVEDDCWLGVNTVIMPGVTVGKGCVVGANSVVTRDLPPYVVAVGSPAHIIKNRLEFKPPKSIDCMVDSDLPYFYSGIGVSKADRERSRDGNGLPGDSEFSIALDPAGARSICLIAKSNVDEPCTVKHLEENRELTREYKAIQFPISNREVSRFFFRVQIKNQRWPITIKKAWVE
jgi:acetyltransferase-like isoleucine patch superfamily enzyme